MEALIVHNQLRGDKAGSRVEATLSKAATSETTIAQRIAVFQSTVCGRGGGVIPVEPSPDSTVSACSVM